jgi:hypothetical protein
MKIKDKRVSRDCCSRSSKLHRCPFDLLKFSAHSRLSFLTKIQEPFNHTFIPAEAHHISINQKYGPDLGIRISIAALKLTLPQSSVCSLKPFEMSQQSVSTHSTQGSGCGKINPDPLIFLQTILVSMTNRPEVTRLFIFLNSINPSLMLLHHLRRVRFLLTARLG